MAGGEIGSSRRRRPKRKTKDAAPRSEATNLKSFSCNCCDQTFLSSQALGAHQGCHKDKAKKPVPDPDKAMDQKLPDGSSDDIPSFDAEAKNSRDRRQVHALCRTCGKRGDHWTFQCQNYQDKAKEKLLKEEGHAAENLVPKVSDDTPCSEKAMEKLPEGISDKANDIPSFDAEEENSRDRRRVHALCRICGKRGDHWTAQCLNYQGQATRVGGAAGSTQPRELKPNFSSETKSRLTKDNPKLISEVQEISYGPPYPGSKILQPKGSVTLRQVAEIIDALEKENSPTWQNLTKKREKCFKCGLKMGKDCIHFDENGTYKLSNCVFCSSHGDHWSYECPRKEPNTFWATYKNRIPWNWPKES